jgi:hypothetical protein
MTAKPGDLVLIDHMDKDSLMLVWRELYGLGVIIEVYKEREYAKIHFFSDVGTTTVALYKLEVIS